MSAEQEKSESPTLAATATEPSNPTYKAGDTVYLMLKQEYATLAAEKKSLYAAQNAKKSYMLEVLTAQQNVQRLLGYKDSEQAQGHKHGL